MSQMTKDLKATYSGSSKAYSNLIVSEYQQKLSIFFQKVQKQVQSLIKKYELEIKGLRNQNQILLNKLQKLNKINPQDFYETPQSFRDISPIRKLNQSTNFTKTVENTSNFKGFLNQTDDFLSINSKDLNSSKFNTLKNIKSIYQQNVINSLQLSRTNLTMNNSKVTEVLGLKKQQTSFEKQILCQPTNNQVDLLNTSLREVCSSLDKSFHAQKSRKKHQEAQKQKDKAAQINLQQTKRNYSLRKESGVKNLLKDIRENMMSDQSKQAQSFRSIKILSSFEQNKNQRNPQQKGKSKSKVSINPIAIDVSQRNTKVNWSENKKPQSILKESSLFLSKSLLQNSVFFNETK